jgi:hypothetical protein
LLLFIAAAFLVIGFPPSFAPGAGAFDRVEPAICKTIGAALMLGLTWLFVRPDRNAQAMLNLPLSGRNVTVLLGSALVASLIILCWLLVLRFLVPFHLERGTTTAVGFAFSVLVHLFGSIIAKSLRFAAFRSCACAERMA